MATEQELLGVRPRLRNDAVFLRVETGLYLRHSETACVLKGKLAYQWMSVLGPRMNGERSVEQLCDGLSAGQRQTVLGLTKALLDRGFVRDVPAPTAGELPASVARHFQPQLNFIEHFAGGTGDSPAQRLAAFRAARILVVGPTPVLLAAVAGLARNGAGQVSFVAPADGTDVPAALEGTLADLRAADVSVTLTPLTAVPEDLSAGYQLIIYAASGGHVAELLTATRRLRTATPPIAGAPKLLPIVLSGDRLVLGPMSSAASAPCWVCAQLRLAANGAPADAADAWREVALGLPVERAGGTGGSGTVPAMIGNAAALEAFRLLAGLSTDAGDGFLVIQDTETLNSSRERLLAHPACPLCRDQPPPAGPALAEDTPDDVVYDRALPLVSALVGPLSGWADEPLDQIPLKIGRVRVTGAGALSGGTRVISALHTETILSARLAAMFTALTWYAGTVTHRTDTVEGPADQLVAAGHRVLPGHLLPSWRGLTPTDEATRTWVPARPLTGGTAHLAPQAAVYPRTSLNGDGRFERTPAGAAAGRSEAELIPIGLTRALAYRGLVAAVRGGAVVELSAQILDADDEARFALRSLAHIGRQVSVHALPGAAPAHAVLVSIVDSPLWAVGSALSARAALRAALRDALGLAQTAHYEGSAADLGDPLLADFHPGTRLRVTEGDWSPDAAVSLQDALAALPALGLSAHLVDTTPTDLRSVGAIRTGTVVLAG